MAENSRWTLGVFAVLVMLNSQISIALELPVNKRPTLKIFNWEDYLSEEVVAEFEKRYQVKIDVYYYEHDEERDEIMATRNGAGYDLLLVGGQSIPGYARLGWLAPVTEKEVPNLVHLDAWWQTYTPDATDYAVPYGWGTYGIAYRSDLVEKPVTSYRQLFQPAASLKGKVLMSPQALELVPAALKAAGHSLNSIDSQALGAAEVLLKSQQPYVFGYRSLKLTEQSSLVTGAVHAAMAYNGDASSLKEFDPNIVYTDADEGQILWFDYWVVLNSSRQKALAYQFLNYLQTPEVNAKNVLSIYTATFNRPAIALLPEEIKQDTAVFPVIKSNAEYFIEPAPRSVRKIFSIWHQLNTNNQQVGPSLQ